MISLKNVVRTATGYVKRRPHDGFRVLRGFLTWRFALPIEALRWAAEQLDGGNVRDLAIREIPPGLRLLASVETMGTPIRAGATVCVDQVSLGAGELRIEISLHDVQLELLDHTVQTSVAMLIKSGALDLSLPANLIAHLPHRPELIVDAQGERVTLDLMRVPKLANHPALKRWLPIVAQVLEVRALTVDRGFIELNLGLVSTGLSSIRDRIVRT